MRFLQDDFYHGVSKSNYRNHEHPDVSLFYKQSYVYMHKVRITVLKTTLDKELADEYGVEGIGPCPMLRGARVPGGLREARGALRRGLEGDVPVRVRSGPHGRGRAVLLQGLIREPGVAICSCNDGLRPVIFKLERTDIESEP